MKQLRFDYTMHIQYAPPVDRCWFTLKCFPRNTARQRVLELRTELSPEAPLSQGTDGLGNPKLYGRIPHPHDSFSLRVSGLVQIDQLLYEEEADPAQIPLFRCPGTLTRPDDALRRRAEILPRKGDAYDQALAIMHAVHAEMTYSPGVTGPDTPAVDAWALHRGVCQDYAHVFVTLCRLAGIPARYVTGLIAGEGASHAWAEICRNGRWIGMDPTNDLLVNHIYIRFAHGRDAADCRMNRGILHGRSLQQQVITASVWETDEACEQGAETKS